MAMSSVEGARGETRSSHSNSTRTHGNEPRHNNNHNNRRPHNNNYRRRDGPGSSRGGGHNYSRRGQVANKKQMTLDECQHLLKGVPGRTHHGDVKMQGDVRECDICCRESDLFAVGECSHPICMECAIRLRIVSNTDTCPQCRATLDSMTFVSYPGDWDRLEVPKGGVHHADCERYGIKFSSDYAVKCYNSYMAHVCLICEKKGEKEKFATFAALHQHVWMFHKLQYCDICVEHLNLLSRERRLYSILDLERHLETGDPDDKSQKGHPLCLFCEKRFLDDEFQYKHLRKDHFFCQICDADGKSNYFFPEHKDLLRHYRNQHVICEEGECRRMGIAFRTDTELKLHMSRDHAAGRQRLNLDFHYSDRNLGVSSRGGTGRGLGHSTRGGGPSGRGGAATQRNTPRIGIVPAEQPPITARAPDPVDVVIVPSAQNQPATNKLRYSTAPTFRMEGNDFPRLGGAGPSRPRPPQPQPQNQFPTLQSTVTKTTGTRHAASMAGPGPSSNQATGSTKIPNQSSSKSSSWFIDDDEVMPPHRPHPAMVQADAQRSEEAQDKASGGVNEAEASKLEEEEPRLETSWGGAIRRPNSFSSLASALTANAFPTLGQPAKPTHLPKNLPRNSAWAKNKLSFPHSASSSAIVGCVVPERSGDRKRLPQPDIWPEEAVPSNWEERDATETAESERFKQIGKTAKGNMELEEREETNTKKKKNKKEKTKQQQKSQMQKTESKKVEPLPKAEVKDSHKRIERRELTASEVKVLPKNTSSNTTHRDSTIRTGTNVQSTNKEKEPQKSREVNKEPVKVAEDPFPTLSSSNAAMKKEESSEQAPATIATSFSQMLSSAFSSLMGSTPAQPTPKPSAKGNVRKEEKEDTEDFPSLGGKVVKETSNSSSSAWTKGPLDLSPVKAASSTKKHPAKKELPVPDVWPAASGVSQTPESKKTPTTLPAGIGMPPGIGAPPGFAPPGLIPPGFGPPPGFERSDCDKWTTVTAPKAKK